MSQSPRVVLCRPGQEGLLADELRLVWPGSSPAQEGEGVVLAHTEGTEVPAFALQVMPEAERVEGAVSIRAWSERVMDHVVRALEGYEGPWRLHVVAHVHRGSQVRAGRLERILEGTLDLLRRRQKRLLPLLRHHGIPPAPPVLPGVDQLDGALVQVLLVTAEQGWISVTMPEAARALGRLLSPFPGGMVAVHENREPPSRAHLKLSEALLHLGREMHPGETCVDLGACPGGWTWVARRHGARVTAVDRSPLREDLGQDRGVTFEQADAFSYRPAAPVDWLVCDVIAFPERTLALLDTWLSERRCRFFVVTIKFKGEPDVGAITQARTIIARNAEGVVRQLGVNKNEVTALGRVLR